MTTRWLTSHSIGLAALALGMVACGCSGKRAKANETASKPSDQASNALVATPAPPAPTPIPYPAVSAPRDVATGQSSGKRQHGTVSTLK